MRPALLAGFVLVAAPVAGLAQSGPYLAVVTDPGGEAARRTQRQVPRSRPRFPRASRCSSITRSPTAGSRCRIRRHAVLGKLGADVSSWTSTLPRMTPQRNGDGEQDDHNAASRPDGLRPTAAHSTAKVPRRTILTVIGGRLFEGKTWYPVAPPVGRLPVSAQAGRAIERTREHVVRGARHDAPSPVPTGFTGRVRPGSSSRSPGIANFPPSRPRPLENRRCSIPLWARPRPPSARASTRRRSSSSSSSPG
jgi:hypothetical protein